MVWQHGGETNRHDCLKLVRISSTVCDNGGVVRRHCRAFVSASVNEGLSAVPGFVYIVVAPGCPSDLGLGDCV